MTIRESRIEPAMPPGGFVRAYVKHATRRADAPAAYHLPLALSILAAAAPRHLCIDWAPRPLYANWWCLCVGSSGDGKTSAISIATDLIREALPDYAASSDPGSVEAFQEMMKQESKRHVIYPEFGSFLAKTAEGYARPIRERYTELYDSMPVSVVFKKGTVTIEDPRFCMTAGVTPAHLEAYTNPGDWEGGWMSRYCVIAGVKERWISIPPLSTEWRAEHNDLVTMVRDLATKGSVDIGQYAGFEADAAEMWDEWYAGIQSTVVSERLHGAVQRSQLTALKAALLFSWDTGACRVGRGKPWRLNASVLEPALELANLHIESIQYVANHIGESNDMRDRQKVLRAVNKGARTLGAILIMSRLLSKRCNEILDSLVTEGSIRRQRQADETTVWLPVITAVPDPKPRVNLADRLKEIADQPVEDDSGLVDAADLDAGS